MKPQIIECEQGSPEWFAARAGRVTASRVHDVVAKSKTGWGASRSKYMGKLLVERLTGRVVATYQSEAMSWGLEQEPVARSAYSFLHNCDVAEVGFVQHPRIAMSGASPDGQVGDTGLVEFKCPDSDTHSDVLLGGSIDGKHIKQVQWQMACTGRAWCDFVSFDPRYPPSMQMLVRRVHRDDAMIKELEGHVRDFLAELDGKEKRLRAQYGELTILAAG